MIDRVIEQEQLFVSKKVARWNGLPLRNASDILYITNVHECVSVIPAIAGWHPVGVGWSLIG